MLRLTRFLSRSPLLALAALLTASQLTTSTALLAAASESPPSFAQPSGEPTRFSLEFNGGTLQSLINDLRRNPEQAVNLLAEEKFLGLPVPAFSVRDAHSESFIFALGRLLERHHVRIEAAPKVAGLGNTRAVYVVIPTSRQPDTTKEFVCFALSDLEPTPGIEAITDAVRTSWKMDPSHRDEELRIQYHPGTKMLLAHGSKEAMVVVDRVVGALLAQTAARKARFAEAFNGK